jgi:hypothetical protein
MFNNSAEETEEERNTIERRTEQQQDDTAMKHAQASSLTCEKNQYTEDESDGACDMGMATDIKRGRKGELDYNDMEQHQVSKPSNEPVIDRDIDKIGRKRDNPNTNKRLRTGRKRRRRTWIRRSHDEGTSNTKSQAQQENKNGR